MSSSKVFKLANSKVDWFSDYEKYENKSNLFLGIWHGAISPITIVISLIRKNQHLVEKHMSIGYYVGFIASISSYIKLISLLLNGGFQ